MGGILDKQAESKPRSAWEDVGPILTPKGFRELRAGQVLVFNYEGSRNEYRVMRIDRKRKRCWVVPTTLYKPEQVGIVDAKH